MPITFGDRDHTKDYWYIEGQKDLRAEIAAQTKVAKAKLQLAKAESQLAKAELLVIEAEKNAAIQNFLNLGLPPEVIAKAMMVAVEKILAIQEKLKNN